MTRLSECFLTSELKGFAGRTKLGRYGRDTFVSYFFSSPLERVSHFMRYLIQYVLSVEKEASDGRSTSSMTTVRATNETLRNAVIYIPDATTKIVKWVLTITTSLRIPLTVKFLLVMIAVLSHCACNRRPRQYDLPFCEAIVDGALRHRQASRVRK